MSVSVFRVGKRHGENDIKRMSHRKSGQYDSANNQRSYDNGYQEGLKIRYNKQHC